MAGSRWMSSATYCGPFCTYPPTPFRSFGFFHPDCQKGIGTKASAPSTICRGPSCKVIPQSVSPVAMHFTCLLTIVLEPPYVGLGYIAQDAHMQGASAFTKESLGAAFHGLRMCTKLTLRVCDIYNSPGNFAFHMSALLWKP